MRADVEQYSELRKQGLTYREIGERVGYSETKIRRVLNEHAETQFRCLSPVRCVYEGLRNWLNKNEWSVAELAQRIYGEACSSVEINRYYKLLRGERSITIGDIDDMILVTGCTYEELFGMENSAKGINNANHKRNK